MSRPNDIRPPVDGGTSDRGRGPVVHIVGARPNFMKAAPVMKALAAAGIPERIVEVIARWLAERAS